METTTNKNGLASLTKSLIAVQRAVQGAKPNKLNPHLKNKYADLGSVWDTCRDLLADNGLAVMHTFKEGSPDTVTCVATLLHESGESVTSELTLRPKSTTPQEMGSAITYARRYTLAALIGIVVDDDDDAAKASQPAKDQPQGIDAKKEQIRKLLKTYKGKDREQMIGECQIAQETGNFDNGFADGILKKLAA